jgi:flavorubredoxin
MVTYDSAGKILYSADAFGAFVRSAAASSPTRSVSKPSGCPKPGVYSNIVGKYGAQVQALLKKAEGLDIRLLCPLHGRYGAQISLVCGKVPEVECVRAGGRRVLIACGSSTAIR